MELYLDYLLERALLTLINDVATPKTFNHLKLDGGLGLYPTLPQSRMMANTGTFHADPLPTRAVTLELSKVNAKCYFTEEQWLFVSILQNIVEKVLSSLWMSP